MIYVYALGEERRAPAALGIDERPVESLAVGRLTAFVSQLDAVAPTYEALHAHHRVAAAASAESAALPLRFGTLVVDEDAVRTLVAERSAGLERALRRVRGRVELGARVLWREAAPAAHSGRDFLARKLERLSSARAARDELHAPLASLAVGAVCRLLPDAGTAFSAAYLVDRDRVACFERAAAALAHGDLEVVRSGPWPPYSFSE